MHVSASPRRPARKAAATIAAAVGLTIALSGCASGDDSEPSAKDSNTPTASAAASATGAAGQSQDNQCGGKSTDPEASLTRSSDIDIDAPIERVWDVHTDVVKWKKWQDAVLTIERLDSGAFSSTSQFRWTTPVPKSDFAPADTLTITSSVKHVESGTCVIWEGPAKGKAITIDKGTHLWIFTKTDNGTHVHTQESWDAPLLDSLQGADRDAVADMLGGGLDVWLQALKAEVEAPTS
ncbi:SRPBCC family protein [Streptomyces sp. NBC_01429]|uniref:SRPBCC family protein n=1 Tax=Streptomyces sp. NBC_01429 TaxID=2903862 RepID=UPI002E2DE932|nr:SRPBCC family protein [Streptomyces sp. NBC_01429]